MVRTSLTPSRYQYEEASWAQNQVVMGIDEVGRGCFAGPVVAAAVSMPGHLSQPLFDSKQLTDERLEELYHTIISMCIVGVGTVPAHYIDQWGIVEATRCAMHRALSSVETCSQGLVSHILVDAVALKHPHIPVIAKPFGEQWSASIAAASIVAKVTRDRLLRALGPSFPVYNLEQHHGYGTKSHRTALSTYGCSLSHRCTFWDPRIDDVQTSFFTPPTDLRPLREKTVGLPEKISPGKRMNAVNTVDVMAVAPFAEVVQSSITSCILETWNWDEPVSLGDLIRIPAVSEDLTLWGTVIDIHKGMRDGSPAIAYHRDHATLQRDMPHIFAALITTVTVHFLGYTTATNASLQPYIPPSPLALHCAAYQATAREYHDCYTAPSCFDVLCAHTPSKELLLQRLFCAIRASVAHGIPVQHYTPLFTHLYTAQGCTELHICTLAQLVGSLIAASSSPGAAR